MLQDNKFNEQTGLIEGDHLRHLAKTGYNSLIERVNHQIGGGERPLKTEDLPAKVKTLVEQSNTLSSQLLKCENVPLQTAVDYIKSQQKIAASALPLIQAEKKKREKDCREAFINMRATLTGKGNNLVEAGVDVLLQNADIKYALEREAGLSAWRTAFAIVRDAAAGKGTTPRWLTMLIAQHEAHKLKTVS